MFGPVLRGDHVTLRPADDNDPARFVPWFADMEVTRYLGRRTAVALYYEVDTLKKFGESDNAVFWMIEADGETIKNVTSKAGRAPASQVTAALDLLTSITSFATITYSL